MPSTHTHDMYRSHGPLGPATHVRTPLTLTSYSNACARAVVLLLLLLAMCALGLLGWGLLALCCVALCCAARRLGLAGEGRGAQGRGGAYEPILSAANTSPDSDAN